MKFGFVNALSVSRICIAAVFLYLYLDPDADLRRFSFIMLVVSIVTDVLDGVLARAWRVTSKLGYVLDGVGDRASYVAIFFAISYRDGFPVVLSYGFIVRDILLYAARSLYSDWWRQSESHRRFSKGYALAVRILMLIYFTHSASGLFGKTWNERPWETVQSWITVLAIVMMTLSYLSLALLVRDYMRSEASPKTNIDF